MPRALLARLWAGWKRLAHALGQVQNVLLLTVVYHLGIGPLALIGRLARRDPLGLRRPPEGRYATPPPPPTRTLEEAKRPF